MSCKHKDHCPFYEEECEEWIDQYITWPYVPITTDNHKWNEGVL